ncbi:MAG: NAD(P)H-hydrate dehydratase [Muribaculaceae bacterium]|nr:NAD(P)H-hydrate dehydratase [Muribaculaceae bacterium]
MKIFTSDDIRQIDRYTIKEEGVSSRELIKRVASGVVTEIISRWRPTRPITVFAGPGNNGADALEVARQLSQQGYHPEVLLFNIGGNALSRDCKAIRDELIVDNRVPLTEVIDNLILPELTSAHIIVDGLFGTGLREPLTGGFQALVRVINESRATVVSIDVPSGLFSDWNPLSINKNIIHADLTIAVQFPRLAFFMAENHELVGEYKVIDIGLSAHAIRSTRTKYHLIETNDIAHVLHPRNPFASKADFGNAMLIAGSFGMMGAAVVAAQGALRAGVGKLTVHAPRCGYPVLQTAVPEAMFAADNHETVLTECTPGDNFTAVAIGPGLGTHDYTLKAVETVIKTARHPIVVDADALNCIARRPALLNALPNLSILTPHAGEFDRLFGQHNNAEARLIKAVEMSRQYNVIIVLKGRYTATIRPDGKIYFNSSGTPALATPGSGDVLTGIILAMLAQGLRPEVAALTGVFVHGLAGEIACETMGEYGTTAGDVARATALAIKSIIS